MKSLLPDQLCVVEKLLCAVRQNQLGIYFLDAPGGTGKTFIIQLLLSTLRLEGMIAIAVASSGIAATQLQGGRTAHSAFKLPLDLASGDKKVCNIEKQSHRADLLRKTRFIVWDECTMLHKAGLDAVNRCLQDCRDSKLVMGGIVCLLAGDFRQTLPVIPRGTMGDEIDACIKFSDVWPHVQRLSIRTNMRAKLQGDTSAQQFSDSLLSVGNGDDMDGAPTARILLPSTLAQRCDTIESLIMTIFPPDMIAGIGSTLFSKSLLQRAILCPKNDDADHINEILLEQVAGEEISYCSVDTTETDDQAVRFPIEYLHATKVPGQPQHILKLKVGAPIMLLRNLDPPRLCNGTRLIVKRLGRYIIEAILPASRDHVEETVLIPRIPLLLSLPPLEFKRLQFPVRLCFGITINKSQGQTMERVGICLTEEVFAHGQLYVALSRVGSPQDVFVLCPNPTITNVVYHAVLQ